MATVEEELVALKKQVRNQTQALKETRLRLKGLQNQVEDFRETNPVETNKLFPPPDPDAPKRGPKPKGERVPASAASQPVPAAKSK